MKEKVPRIEGRKLDKYYFEYGNDDLKKQINLLDPVKDLKKIEELRASFKTYSYHIQEPTIDQLFAANGELYDSRRLRLELAGKVIWELCCVSYDPIIDTNPKILLDICTMLSEYVLPLDLDIKKK